MLCPPHHLYFRTHHTSDALTVYGAPLPCAPGLDVHASRHQHLFGVYWDEDHDERVLNLVDTLHHHNVLSDFVAFHEHEGCFWAVAKPHLPETRIVQALTVLDGASCDVLGDVWSWHAGCVGRAIRVPPDLSFGNGATTYWDFPIATLTADANIHELGSLVTTDKWGEPL